MLGRWRLPSSHRGWGATYQCDTLRPGGAYGFMGGVVCEVDRCYLEHLDRMEVMNLELADVTLFNCS